MNRGFALEIEENYGEDIEPNEFNPAWFQDVDSADFKLNDDIITKSGGSRMDQVARPGVLKPSGSISADVDLQRIIYYFFGLLDNYKCTDNNDGTYIHEFWGGEGKDLKSFRGIAVYDMLVQYLYGIIIDSLKLECSDEKMELSADTIYKTEKSEILNENEEFELPDELENDLFITFYDITLLLNNKKPDGVVNSFDLETKNNLDQDNSIGFGSRGPQAKANARKRENSVSLKTYLTRDTVESILNAKYGKVGAREPEACKLLQIPLALKVRLCEYAELGLGMDLIFPRCTVKAEFDMSGVDEIETTLDLATLGSDNVTLDDGTDVVACDPIATEKAKAIFGSRIEYETDPYKAVKDADAVILVTEWDEFKYMDMNKVKDLMRGNVFIDGRGVFKRSGMLELGFRFDRIG